MKDMKNKGLMCGYAQADITPTASGYLDGFAARSKPSSGVRDPLYLKVLSLKDSCNGECLIIVFDLLGFDESLHGKLRDAAREASGLSDENIMILATHTHSGPACGVLYGLPKDEAYWGKVAKLLKESIHKAQSTYSSAYPILEETEIHIGINRRMIVDGKVVIGENPDKMRDDTLRVLNFVNGEKVIGALCNTSCHPVNLSAENINVSADYPSALHKYANDRGDLFALFTQGTCGNINPIRKSDSPEDNLVSNGNALVSSFEKLISGKKTLPFDTPSIECFAKDISIPLQLAYDKATLEDKYNYWRKRINDLDQNTAYRAKVYSHWYEIQLDAVQKGKVPSVNARVRLFSIDNFGILSLPFETFIETGRALCDEYEAISGKKLIVCGHADRVLSYLPDPTSLVEGGYEAEGACVWYAIPGKYTKDSEPTLIEGCRKLFLESVK